MPAGLDGNPDPISTPARDAVIGAVGAAVLARSAACPDRVLRVAVDGIDGAGKSTLADELTRWVQANGVTVIRSTIDSFHNPRSVRWARGKGSPVGFYRDSHDLDALERLLLRPLSEVPPRPYVAAAFDEPTDTAVPPVTHEAHPGEVLVFDGIFLQRPELRGTWDLTVFVDGWDLVTSTRVERAAAGCPVGPAAWLHLAWWWVVLERYVGGQRLYFEESAPIAHADLVVDNNDLRAPRITIDRRSG
jgi:uridine kinase